MAPQGWQRQRKWQAREWVRLVFRSMKLYTQDNIIRQVAMSVELDENEDNGSEPDTSMSNHDDDEHIEDVTIGPLVRWSKKGKTDKAVWARHKMVSVMMYIRHVVRPQIQEERRAAAEAQRVRRARRQICMLFVRAYKNTKQQEMLSKRVRDRGERICSRTKNVGRLTPKVGVVYCDTRVNTTRIRETALYKTHRWPRRDKIGPTLVGSLQHLWGIT